jgi:F0F1-type ATP synthase membrane subunit b/b'
VEEGIASADKAAERAVSEAREEAKRESAARVDEGRRAIESDRAAAESRLPRAVDRLIEDFESTVSKG